MQPATPGPGTSSEFFKFLQERVHGSHGKSRRRIFGIRLKYSPTVLEFPDSLAITSDHLVILATPVNVSIPSRAGVA